MSWSDPRAPMSAGYQGGNSGSIYRSCCDVPGYCEDLGTPTFPVSALPAAGPHLQANLWAQVPGTETFLVFHIADTPFDPVAVSTWDLADPPNATLDATTNVGTAGGDFGQPHIIGNTMYVLTNNGADYSWDIFDVTSPTAPSFISRNLISGSPTITSYADDVADNGQYVMEYGYTGTFSVDEEGAVWFFELSATPGVPTLVATVDFDQTPISLPGVSVTHARWLVDENLLICIGREGVTTNYHIVTFDVTDPTAPLFRSKVTTSRLVRVMGIHDGTAFFSGDAGDTLHVWNFQDVSNPSFNVQSSLNGFMSAGRIATRSITHPLWGDRYPIVMIDGQETAQYVFVTLPQLATTDSTSSSIYDSSSLSPALLVGGPAPPRLGSWESRSATGEADFNYVEVSVPNAAGGSSSLPSGPQSNLTPVVGNGIEAVPVVLDSDGATAGTVTGGPPRWSRVDAQDGTTVVCDDDGGQFAVNGPSTGWLANGTYGGKRSMSVEHYGNVLNWSDDEVTAQAYPIYNGVASFGAVDVPLGNPSALALWTLASPPSITTYTMLAEPVTQVGGEAICNKTGQIMSGDGTQLVTDLLQPYMLEGVGLCTRVVETAVATHPNLDYTRAVTEGDGQSIDFPGTITGTEYLSLKLGAFPFDAISATGFVLDTTLKSLNGLVTNLAARIISKDRVIAAADSGGTRQVVSSSLPTSFCRRRIIFDWVNPAATSSDLQNAYVEYSWTGNTGDTMSFDYIASGAVYSGDFPCAGSISNVAPFPPTGPSQNLAQYRLVSPSRMAGLSPSGFSVVDISNLATWPDNETAFLDASTWPDWTHTNDKALLDRNSRYYYAMGSYDPGGGFRDAVIVFDLADPDNPVLDGIFVPWTSHSEYANIELLGNADPTNVEALIISVPSGSAAWGAGTYPAFRIYTGSDGSSPTVVASVETNHSAFSGLTPIIGLGFRITASLPNNRYVWTHKMTDGATTAARIFTWDLSDPSNPVHLGTAVSVDSEPLWCFPVSDTHIWLWTQDGTVTVVDTDNPIAVAGTFPLTDIDGQTSIAIVGQVDGYVVALTSNGFYSAIDVSNPLAPFIQATGTDGDFPNLPGAAPTNGPWTDEAPRIGTTFYTPEAWVGVGPCP